MSEELINLRALKIIPDTSYTMEEYALIREQVADVMGIVGDEIEGDYNYIEEKK